MENLISDLYGYIRITNGKKPDEATFQRFRDEILITDVSEYSHKTQRTVYQLVGLFTLNDEMPYLLDQVWRRIALRAVMACADDAEFKLMQSKLQELWKEEDAKTEELMANLREEEPCEFITD